MLDVLYSAIKYMNVEDALLAREEKPKKKDKNRHDRIGDRRQQGLETDKRISAPNPPLEVSRASPH